jgi:hypothetical protein
MLRSMLTTLVAVLCLVAVLSAINPDPKALVAKVGDRPYEYKSFNDGFKAYLDYHGRGKTFTAQDSVRLNNQYWEELVGIYVYDQAIKAGKIKITNAELEANIKKNIPEGVKQIPEFQTKGKFDKAKYEKGLAEKPDFKKMVIEYTRDLYSYGKLIDTIKKEVTANPDSVKAIWLKDNTRADATIIAFDYTKLDSIKVSDSEAQMYYTEHKQEYKRENGRGYLLVRFTGGLSKADQSVELVQENKSKSAALYTRAKEIGLTKATEEMGLKAEESLMFNGQDEIIPLIGRAPALIAFAYANPIGSIPEIYYAPTGDIYVLELNREMPEYYISFEVKKQEIMIVATRTKRMFYMDNYVQTFMKNETTNSYLSAAARDSIATFEATGLIADSDITGIGKVFEINKAILSTPEGEFTPLIEKDKKWYLAKVNKRSQPDLTLWEKDKNNLIDKANKDMQQDHLNDWYLKERKKIEIIDNRHEYYPIRQLIKM